VTHSNDDILDMGPQEVLFFIGELEARIEELEKRISEHKSYKVKMNTKFDQADQILWDIL
jgi:hypothetical protein